MILLSPIELAPSPRAALSPLIVQGGEEVAGFDVSYSSVVYDGTVPTVDCTVTYRDVRVFSDAPASAFDLTLVSHFRGD